MWRWYGYSGAVGEWDWNVNKRMEVENLGIESVNIFFKKFEDEKIFLKIVFIVWLYLLGKNIVERES